MEPNRSTDNTTFHAFFLRRLIIIWLFMEIRIKAYAYTIDIITEIRYFCKCNNAVFGKFRIIFTYTISKTNCSLHHNFHALFKISGNGKFVRTAVLPPRPSRNLSKSTPRPRPALNLPPLSKGGGLTARHKLSLCCIFTCDTSTFLIYQTFRRQDGGIATPLLLKPHYPLPRTTKLASLVKGEVLSPEKIRATTRGIAFLPHPFRFSDTSVNNPSVTVTENTILCQRIFNFYKKQC